MGKWTGTIACIVLAAVFVVLFHESNSRIWWILPGCERNSPPPFGPSHDRFARDVAIYSWKAEIFADPFVEARGTVHLFEREGVEVPSVAFPGKLSATPAEFRAPPPRVGEQTHEVLRDWLGLDAAELAELAGAVRQR